MADEELKNESIRVELNARSRAIVERIRDDTGVPKVEAVARLLEWYGSIDRKFRLALITRDIETQREMAVLVLKDLAGSTTTTTEHGPLDQLKLEELHALLGQVSDRIAELALQYRTAAQGKKK